MAALLCRDVRPWARKVTTHELTAVRELAIVVADALSQVEVAVLAVALDVHKGSTQNGDLAIALDREVDVVGRAGEALAVPDKVACSWRQSRRYQYVLINGMIYRCRCR